MQGYGIPMWFLSPSVQGGMLCAIITIIALLVVAQPTLLLLKIDGRISWAWGAVLAPLWVVNVALVLLPVPAFLVVPEADPAHLFHHEESPQ